MYQFLYQDKSLDTTLPVFFGFTTVCLCSFLCMSKILIGNFFNFRNIHNDQKENQDQHTWYWRRLNIKTDTSKKGSVFTERNPLHSKEHGSYILCLKKNITFLDDVSISIYHTCVCYKIVFTGQLSMNWYQVKST